MMAGSLVKIAENKIITCSLISESEITIEHIVVILYDAARTLLEALALLKGYKIYNHECFVPFLKEIMQYEELALLFNKQRLIRNGINYYGEPLLLIEGRNAIKDLNEIIMFAKEQIKREMEKLN
jgi:hypothetical protein